jgi:ABC-2 type transport system ATP-binding protein
VGYLPELFRYQPWLRAREVLGLHGRLIGGGLDRSRAGIDAVLDEVGLLDRAGDLVGDFSKGMQQRLGLAVALLGGPALVVLDEPTSALDPVGRADVRAIIRRARENGSTVFLNSHLLTEVERVCDRVAIVDHGRVLASGRLDDLLGEPAVRIRVTDLTTEALGGLARFGRPSLSDDGWLTVAGVASGAIPDVVAAVVAAGGRVHAVDPGRATLEDRYFELISGRAMDAGDAADDEPGST